MNQHYKKGFTLVELLAVIVVLSVILTMAGISVFGIIASQQEKLLEEQLLNLQDTAITYARSKNYILENCGKESEVNPSHLTNSRCYKQITVKQLIDANFFENKNDLCNESGKITIYRVNTIGTTHELKAYIPDGVCSY